MWKTLKKWITGKVGLKENRIYNHADNSIYVKTDGKNLYIICKSDLQMDTVVNKMTTENCMLSGYEEWDEGEDKKWILTFEVMPGTPTLQSNIN